MALEPIEDLETFNRWGVGVQADKVCVLLPPRGPMTGDEALILAAWLVTLADPLGERFQQVLDKVQS